GPSGRLCCKPSAPGGCRGVHRRGGAGKWGPRLRPRRGGAIRTAAAGAEIRGADVGAAQRLGAASS
ncbi:unnamed protein product, partial [Effrenium voratum]